MQHNNLTLLAGHTAEALAEQAIDISQVLAYSNLHTPEFRILKYRFGTCRQMISDG